MIGEKLFATSFKEVNRIGKCREEAGSDRRGRGIQVTSCTFLEEMHAGSALRWEEKPLFVILHCPQGALNNRGIWPASDLPHLP
jgi:hypothetical protein